jgi:hypothetical protein
MNGEKDFARCLAVFIFECSEGIRGRTCLSNPNRQLQIDAQFLRHMVHHMIDDMLEVDGLVEDVQLFSTGTPISISKFIWRMIST